MKKPFFIPLMLVSLWGMAQSNYVNITSYGASTTNADNTTNIQNAINAISDLGGTLYIPGGTYKTGPLYVFNKKNLTIASDGGILQMKNNAPAFSSSQYSTYPNFNTLHRSFATTYTKKNGFQQSLIWVDSLSDNFRCANITLDGNKANNNTLPISIDWTLRLNGTGLFTINSNNPMLENVTVMNTLMRGISISTVRLEINGQGLIETPRIYRCKVMNTGLVGVDINNANAPVVNDCYVYNVGFDFVKITNAVANGSNGVSLTLNATFENSRFYRIPVFRKRNQWDSYENFGYTFIGSLYKNNPSGDHLTFNQISNVTSFSVDDKKLYGGQNQGRKTYTYGLTTGVTDNVKDILTAFNTTNLRTGDELFVLQTKAKYNFALPSTRSDLDFTQEIWPHGINISQSKSGKIQNCHVELIAGVGIGIANDVTHATGGHIISGCTVKHTGEEGITLDGTVSGTITGCNTESCSIMSNAPDLHIASYDPQDNYVFRPFGNVVTNNNSRNGLGTCSINAGIGMDKDPSAINGYNTLAKPYESGHLLIHGNMIYRDSTLNWDTSIPTSDVTNFMVYGINAVGPKATVSSNVVEGYENGIMIIKSWDFQGNSSESLVKDNFIIGRSLSLPISNGIMSLNAFNTVVSGNTIKNFDNAIKIRLMDAYKITDNTIINCDWSLDDNVWKGIFINNAPISVTNIHALVNSSGGYSRNAWNSVWLRNTHVWSEDTYSPATTGLFRQRTTGNITDVNYAPAQRDVQ